jgi:hypothetical protein
MTKLDLNAFKRAKLAQLDEAHLDPQDRANLVNEFFALTLDLEKPEDIVQYPLYWDILCFCFEMLNGFILQMEDKNVIRAARFINDYMYSIHYSGEVNETDFLGPSREDHEKIWAERIAKFISVGEEGNGVSKET